MPECEFARPRLTKLLMQVGRGDSEAFRLLHDLAFARLLLCAMRIVSTRELGEEVLQESFMAIWRDAASFDASRSAAMTWMMTIVRNKAVDCLRANSMRERLTDANWRGEADNIMIDPLPGPCEWLERDQTQRQIARGLAQLDELARQAIELAFFKDLSHGEVASEMTRPLGTVKTWIRRGCKEMRHHVDQSLRESAASGK